MSCESAPAAADSKLVYHWWNRQICAVADKDGYVWSRLMVADVDILRDDNRFHMYGIAMWRHRSRHRLEEMQY